MVANLRGGVGGPNELFVDGVFQFNPNGTYSMQRWRIGCLALGFRFFAAGYLAFAGFKAGELTAQEHIDLLNWSRSYYGTP